MKNALIACFIFLVSCTSHSLLQTSGLKLQIRAEPPQARVGDDLVIHYILSNESAKRARSCFTVKDGLDFWGSAGVAQGRIWEADHPICIEKFSIAPNKSVQWTSPQKMPSVGSGDVRLSGWIRVVANPDSCDQYGCDQETIRSEEVLIRSLPE